MSHCFGQRRQDNEPQVQPARPSEAMKFRMKFVVKSYLIYLKTVNYEIKEVPSKKCNLKQVKTVKRVNNFVQECYNLFKM